MHFKQCLALSLSLFCSLSLSPSPFALSISLLPPAAPASFLHRQQLLVLRLVAAVAPGPLCYPWRKFAQDSRNNLGILRRMAVTL